MVKDNRHNLTMESEGIWLQQLCDTVQDYSPESLPIEFDAIDQRLADRARSRRRRKIIVWISSAAAVAAIVTSVSLIDTSEPIAPNPQTVVAKSETGVDCEVERDAPPIPVERICVQGEIGGAGRSTSQCAKQTDEPQKTPAEKVVNHREQIAHNTYNAHNVMAVTPSTTIDTIANIDTKPEPEMLVQTEVPEEIKHDEENLVYPSVVNEPIYDFAANDTYDVALSDNSSKWDISVYSMALMNNSVNGTADRHYSFSGTRSAAETYYIGQKWYPSVPINAGVNVRYKFTPRFGVESGLIYTMLAQHRTVYYSDGNDVEDRYKAHYLGIPLRATYDWIDFGRFELYSTLGGSVSFPIATTTSIMSEISSGIIYLPDLYRRNYTQWSVNGSVGLQYNITDLAGVYIEPGVGYYFNSCKRETVFERYPFCFTVQMGLRVSLGK